MAAKKAKAETVGECPECGATRFQRHERGEFVDGKFVMVSVVATCMSFHHVIEAASDKELFAQLRPRKAPLVDLEPEVLEE